MLRRTIRKYRRVRSYIKHISGPNRFRFVFLDILGIQRDCDLTVGQWEVKLRSASPDIKVVLSSLVDKEYSDIEVDSPKLIIDAGANIGTSAVYFASRYPEATIVSLEPEEDNYRLLLENVATYPNVKPLKAAIWGARERRPIRNRNTGAWGYTVSDTDDESEEMDQKIDCITVADVMAEHGVTTVDVLKLDIEGGEKDVLENSDLWINNVNVLTVELHDRICMGCSRAFYLATRDFSQFEKHGEKVTATR